MPFLRIDVTSEDIIEGTPRSCSGCPIALAAKRVLSGALTRMGGIFVEVEDGLLNITYYKDEVGDELMYSVSTGREADYFIFNFDRGNDVKPFSFDVEIPDYVFSD